jgi:RNA 2',3'-cyclic 3'-phosphodiesterase
MRLFVALDIPEEIRGRIARFQEGLKAVAPDVRWVSTESFHVTLKFIGEAPGDHVDGYKHALNDVRSQRFEVSFRGYGFFPTARSARVLWVGIEAPEDLAQLAQSVDRATHRMGIAREEHEFKPHLTLARAGSGRPQKSSTEGPNRRFERAAKHLEHLAQPEFGTMTATEFFLYESKLSPRGAQYTKLARFSLEDSGF